VSGIKIQPDGMSQVTISVAAAVGCPGNHIHILACLLMAGIIGSVPEC